MKLRINRVQIKRSRPVVCWLTKMSIQWKHIAELTRMECKHNPSCWFTTENVGYVTTALLLIFKCRMLCYFPSTWGDKASFFQYGKQFISMVFKAISLPEYVCRCSKGWRTWECSYRLIPCVYSRNYKGALDADYYGVLSSFFKRKNILLPRFSGFTSKMELVIKN